MQGIAPGSNPGQNPLQEPSGAGFFRIAENILRRTFFHDDALVHEDDPVGHFLGEGHLMRDDDHCGAFLGQFSDDLQHFADQFRIQSRSGFVEQDDVRIHCQSAGDTNPLLLAS